ncbi:undecaprenyl-phosphate glucose phosphotransferase [Rhizobiales bacterium]|uniref:undecaprenyl-phosphate glucose phosphotransferase n=1 Tax=Hongsoonwoonella zoysiae TaxID=2821844 RepID=UPI0015611DB1|nr:undecaprenyl-phosphate glucose phosphotransferase [Hongsoonwoonella zoysiae]NRG18432.1 undecaprenyl-phosphate glucose phosphotransferase [Hongsoonwoonella zoysiae]
MFDNDASGNLVKKFDLHEVSTDPHYPEGFRQDELEDHRLPPRAAEIARTLQTSTISPSVLGGSLRLIDLVIVGGLGLATLHSAVPGLSSVGWMHIVPLIAAIVLSAAFFQAADCYQIPVMRTVLPQVGRTLIAWSMVFAVFLIAGTFLKPLQALPNAWFGLWYAFALIALTLSRTVLSVFVRGWTKKGRLERRAIIVGGGEAAADLIHEIEAQSDNDIRICGIFDDRGDDRSPPLVAGYPKLGTIKDLVNFARIARIDMLIVTIPLRAEKRLVEFLQKLWVLPVDIRLSAHTDKVRFRERASSFIGTVPFVDVVEKPIADWDAISKRVFDLLFSALLLAVLSPVMLAVAAAIRLDSKGPVLFRQKRYGFNNEVINVLKFRSMYQDMADPAARKVVTKNDPRVTPVGRFIRKTSLDELPQLFNVLRGELSLVGPRPHAVNAHTNERLWEQVVDGYYARHKVRPGVTGWAQINGWRGEVDTPEKIQKRVEFDVYYIENWSVLFDLYILLRTPFALLNTENAY